MAKEKTSGIYFKVSEKERQLIEQRIEEAGVSNMSAFIRKMCLNGLIVRLDIPQIPDCSRYLKSASNNLNQLSVTMTFLFRAYFGIWGATLHRQTFRLGQGDIVIEFRVDKGLDVICRPMMRFVKWFLMFY